MKPDFPHNIRIRLAQLKFFCCVLTLLYLCPVACLSFEKLNWDSQQGRDLATSGGNKKISIGPILFLYYEESLVSSNLNLNLLVLILMYVLFSIYINKNHLSSFWISGAPLYDSTMKFQPSSLFSTNDNTNLTFQMVCGPVIAVERDVKGRNFDVPSYNSQSSSGKSEET